MDSWRRAALEESRCRNELRFVEDGAELMDSLRGRGKYVEAGSAPAPGLILLDLNLPGNDGREALAEIKGDPALKPIPVVILTTGNHEEDVIRSYALGANAFVTKPVTFGGLVDCLNVLNRFRLEIVQLPSEPPQA